MIIIGLTGSIGMGKTTTAQMFAEEGAPVWGADEAVHALYEEGGEAVAPIRVAFPDALSDGRVDRTRLSQIVHADPEAFAKLEAIVHPLVAHARTAFLDRARFSGRPAAVLDVPLLFETGADRLVDAVVVVSAPEAVQRERVLSRPGMDDVKLAALLERQTPDAHKREKADFVIDTSQGMKHARAEVREILRRVSDPSFRSRVRGLD
jgi:dephospho-CoA kinase